MKQEKEDKSMSLMKAIKEYINLKLEYFQLSLAERTSILIGNLVFITFMAVFGLILFVLFLVLIDNLLLLWININWLVTVIEIVFSLLTMMLFWIFRNNLIITPVSNMIIRTLLDSSGKIKLNDEEDEDDED
jgi:hypothetical protein